MTPKEVLKLAKEKGALFVDLRFIDLPGLWQHFSIPITELSEDTFENGLGFDGSSIRGFQSIDESDMLLIPDPTTAVMDPFTQHPTIVLICDVKDPITGEWYSRDPRHVAKKAEAYLKKTGIADTVFIGPELEFFFFDSIRFDQNAHSGFYFIDSEAGFWNAGKKSTPEQPNLGYKVRYKGGYFPVAPMDHFQDLRSEMVLALQAVGIRVEVHHHEVATAGQTEIDMRFGTAHEDGRQRLLVQILREADRAQERQERGRSCPSPSSRTTDRACTRTSLSGRAARTFSTRRAAHTRTSRTCAAGTSAAS